MAKFRLRDVVRSETLRQLEALAGYRNTFFYLTQSLSVWNARFGKLIPLPPGWYEVEAGKNPFGRSTRKGNPRPLWIVVKGTGMGTYLHAWLRAGTRKDLLPTEQPPTSKDASSL